MWHLQKKQLIQSVVASIAAVVPLVTQLLGLIIIWGTNISRQNESILEKGWLKKY